jgi:hypothetical protein
MYRQAASIEKSYGIVRWTLRYSYKKSKQQEDACAGQPAGKRCLQEIMNDPLLALAHLEALPYNSHRIQAQA